MAEHGPYSGKVAVVTGGAGGIGAACAERLAQGGAHTVIADIDTERGPAVAARIGAEFVAADVSRLGDNTALFDQVAERFGRLDLVHLNAGIIGDTGPGDRFDPVRYQRIVATNLDSAVFGVQAALPHLRAAGGGAIVVTASAAALRPSIEVYYSATKSAVIGLVRSLAVVLADEGITVNALCPGLVDTSMIAGRREAIRAAGVPVADPRLVADALEDVLDGGGTGNAWLVMADRGIAPFPFADLPVPGADRLRYRGGVLVADNS
ncbi:SDR family NAD(P)-dependent oxidoreductase [Allorhizocola rhizosphaerae]|uniref:SDR family NAD(P)-dependent oxidoreductase n=1 Tax=Allorhizocola rhizosphaerae TaxID=1872709 RepID=UPI000E3DF326|nr:SDR family NAD(P)-dependent oxidoreductase [Allorhizocola rhizosphaerae]